MLEDRSTIYGGGVLTTRTRRGRTTYELRGVTSRFRHTRSGGRIQHPWSDPMPIVAIWEPNNAIRYRVTVSQTQNFGFSSNLWLMPIFGGPRAPVEVEISWFDAGTHRRETRIMIASNHLGPATAEFLVGPGISEIQVRARSAVAGFGGDYVVTFNNVSSHAQDFPPVPTFRRMGFADDLFGVGENIDPDATFYQAFRDTEYENEDGARTGASEFYLVYTRHENGNRIVTYTSGAVGEDGATRVSSKISVVTNADGSIASATLRNDEGAVDLTAPELAALGLLDDLREMNTGFQNAILRSQTGDTTLPERSNVFGLRFYRLDGTITVEAKQTNLRYDARSGMYLSPGVSDGEGNIRRYELVARVGPDGQPVMVNGKQVFDRGATHITNDGLEVIVRNEGTPQQRTELRLANNPFVIDFGDAGEVIGSVLGNYIADGDVLVGVLASATLSAVLGDLGQALNGVLTGRSVGDSLEAAFADFGADFLDSLQSAGIGAVSSFLTGELVKAIGLDGFAGELFSTVAGSVIGTIAQNLIQGAATAAEIFANIGSAASLGSAVGGFLGNKLASELVSFGSIGGQLGSAIGSALGSIAGFAIGKTLFGALGTALAGPLGAAIGAFLGTILGGVIGSLFGGTPRSGADVQWDEASGKFVVANVYSRKGGSKDAAKSIAGAVAETFNSVLDATGGVLLNPEAVQSGNYGMRKKDFVYRPVSTRDKDAITQRFSGQKGADRLVGYGVYQGLTDRDFQIAGGDVFAKRALYNTFLDPQLSATSFESSVILGNIDTAQRYGRYLQNQGAINALMAAEPDSVFAAEWGITLIRAVELGLTRRHASDWFGGFTFRLDQSGTTAADAVFTFEFDSFANRIGRAIEFGGLRLVDSIDVAGQTLIVGTEAGDVITVAGNHLSATSGASNAGLTVNGEAHDGSSVEIAVAATIEAGGGDDVVHASDRGDNVFGGAGNDALYGGRLDDWLLGGDGNDTIRAGSQAGGIGGDGNYLDGGAGDDQVHGGEGSDWLEGGAGADMLDGNGGDDILAGGADTDQLKGGHGDDQYLLRVGDGADEADEVAAGAPVVAGGATGDAVRDRFTLLTNSPMLRNWFGTEFDIDAAETIRTTQGASAPGAVAAVAAGGEDAIVFGQGIEMGDIRLLRSRTAAEEADPTNTQTTGSDLIVQVMGADDQPTGTQLRVR
ncbi:MAG TPA: hypothetical protein VEW25_00545, partial [Allosphingosinicella sp.]|nr:hypothetical protein [Allosphingosinicella sp.]